MSKVFAGALVWSLLASAFLLGETAPAKSKPKSTANKDVQTVTQKLEEFQGQLKQQQAQIAEQQSQIRQLQQQLQQSNAQLQEQGQQTHQLQSSLQQASQRATAAEQTANNLNATVVDMKTSTAGAVQSLQETQKAVKNLDQPSAVHYKGITITPGGYLDATFITRSRNINSDVIGSFNSFPFDNTANANLTEFRVSARQSRFTLLSEGKIGNTKLSGYYEIDFLGAAPTANQVETNSFTPRQRQLWGQVEFSNGLTLNVGQMWSLLTTDRKGMATRAEFIPTTIEGSYVIGWDYTRQTSFRVTKNFSNKTWAGFELANPETTASASYTPPDLFGLNNSTNALSPTGVLVPSCCGTPVITNGVSTNLAPDIIAKVAFEPDWGHYEIKGLGRFFRDRIKGQNNVSYGGGLGAAAVLPLVAKKVDFMIEGLAGSGIGRYGAANGADVTIRPDGRLIPIHAIHIMGGVEFHPQPKLDVYIYGGDEYYRRAPYVNPVNSKEAAGYGSSLAVNTGCNFEVAPKGTSCQAQNKDMYEATGGFYYRFYKGPFGTFQYGMQLAFLHRTTWSGVGGAPQGSDVVGLTSIRYVLP